MGGAIVLSLLLHLGFVWVSDGQEADDWSESTRVGRSHVKIAAIRFQPAIGAEVKSVPVAHDSLLKTEAQPLKAEVQTRKPAALVHSSESQLPKAEARTFSSEDQRPKSIVQTKQVLSSLKHPVEQVSVSSEVSESRPPEETLAQAEEAQTHSEPEGLDQLPVMTEPRTLKTVPPSYPPAARRRAYEGLVMVRAKVGLDGWVQSVELKQSSGHESLDMSALKAVSLWHFHPYQKEGRSSLAWVDIPLEFTLKP